MQPEYLQDARSGSEHPNFSDRGLQLTRSFRALKVWMSIQTFGLAAFRRSVAKGIELAERADAYVRDSDLLEHGEWIKSETLAVSLEAGPAEAPTIANA